MMGTTKCSKKKKSKRVTWAKFNLRSIFVLCISFLFLFCCSNEQFVALRHRQPKNKNKNQTNITKISVTCVLSLTGHYFSCFDSLYISVLNDTHQPICSIQNQRPSQPALLYNSVLRRNPLLVSQCQIPPLSFHPTSQCRVSGKSVLGV